MQTIYTFIACVSQYFFIEVSTAQSYQAYKYGGTLNNLVPDTVDVNASSDMECGRECKLRNCNAFFFQKGPPELCKHVTYNYIDTQLQAGTDSYELFYKGDATDPSNLPWLFCPSMSDGNVVAITSSFQLTFRITLGEVSHTEAWTACTNAGEKLMKIETAEKQAVVQHVLNYCPELSPHDYWLDGYKNDTAAGWLYADGTSVPMNKTHLWDIDAPNNGNDNIGSCIRMRAAKDHRWDDYNCASQTFSYICEPV